MNPYHTEIIEDEFGHLWKPYYQQPHRYYHTVDHIYNMISFAEQFNVKLSLAQLFAIMFHDAIYIPGSEHNEKLSADVMLAALANCKSLVTQHDLDVAYNYILDTMDHVPTQPGSNVVIDLDLFGLAVDYEENSRNIKLEFNYLYPSEEDGISARISFLKGMLNRGKLFHTRPFIEYEQSARDNMLNNLVTLSQ